MNGRRRRVCVERGFEMPDRVCEAAARQQRSTHPIVRRGEIGLLLESTSKERFGLVRPTLVEQRAAKPDERREVSRAERERALEVSGGKDGIALHAFDVTEIVRPARFGRVEPSSSFEIGFGRSCRFRGHEQLSDSTVLSGQCRWRSCRARVGKPVKIIPLRADLRLYRDRHRTQVRQSRQLDIVRIDVNVLAVSARFRSGRPRSTRGARSQLTAGGPESTAIGSWLFPTALTQRGVPIGRHTAPLFDTPIRPVDSHAYRAGQSPQADEDARIVGGCVAAVGARPSPPRGSAGAVTADTCADRVGAGRGPQLAGRPSAAAGR